MLGYVDARPLADLLPQEVASLITGGLGVERVDELLLNIQPRTYAHHGAGVSIESALEGDTVTILGTVTGANSTITNTGKRMFRAAVSDGRTSVLAIFFQAKLPQLQLTPGVRVLMTGKVKVYREQLQLQHPSYIVMPDPQLVNLAPRAGKAQGGFKQLNKIFSPEALSELLASYEWLPVYRGKNKVFPWTILAAVEVVLQQTPTIPEPLDQVPPDLPSMDAAIRGLHHPGSEGPKNALRRLKYNEALSLALVMALRRADTEAAPGPVCQLPAQKEALPLRLLRGLPYQLTPGQQRVLDQVWQDMQGPKPMSRLLQGEVGSGKTVLALLAMVQAVSNGFQAAMLAPTEVLAAQHAHGLKTLLAGAGLGDEVKVVLLTGSLPAAVQQQALLDLVSGEAQIVVGTHSLLQDRVEFFKLGLVVVDEQHKFGVEQRDVLRTKYTPAGLLPHTLVMTATPIPRTIAIATFGDLDVSELRDLPGGRKPIKTGVFPEVWPLYFARQWALIEEQIAAGHQIYVVCPRIEGDRGVLAIFEQLQSRYPQFSLGMLHGRMPAEEKEAAMSSFAAGTTNILVATTVVEVGVDVPNATVMLIIDAENFGISQLHQLRGRVGRGGNASFCLLNTQLDPYQEEHQVACQRLQTVATCDNGFELAEYDLSARGEGNVLGLEQSGSILKFLDFVADQDLITRAAADAASLVARNPQLAKQLVADITSQEFLEKN